MNQVKSTIQKLIQWIKTHRMQSIFAAGVFLILVAGGVSYALLNKPPAALDTTPIAVKKRTPAPVFPSLLTGENVGSEANLTKPVTAIMIENSSEARPQSGLKEGEVIYEAIAEGGITRLLVLYQQNKPQLIGPVRSVRPYYLDWVRPYDATIIHVGGSAQALSEVRNGSYRDIDQFFNAGTYWRVSDRFAPHNVYTSFEKIDAANVARGYATSNPKPFLRADSKPSSPSTATSINIHMSGAAYDSTYAYNKATNSYDRFQGGSAYTDREAGQLNPKVLVVMSVNYSIEFQDTNREVVQTSGTGPVKIFQNGSVVEGTWQRASRDEQLGFVDVSGSPIKLANGQTWISAIPSGNGNVSWQ